MPLIARKLSLLYLSYLRDLLPIPAAGTYSEILVAVCKLLGCAAIVEIIAVSIRNAEGIGTGERIPFAMLVSVVALSVGNLLKEVAVLVCANLVNWAGWDFHSTRTTLDGHSVDEVVRPDGTWDRYIRDPDATIHEWRATDGICHRETLDRPAG